MRTLLIPTDFSQNSLNAAVYGISLAGKDLKRLILVNAFMTPQAGVSVMVSLDEVLAKESVKELEKFEAKLRAVADLEGVQVERKSLHGDIPFIIDSMEEAEGADLIVMGTQGASGLKEALMGSNTSDVIKKAEMPVLAVPQDCEYASPSRILLADDGKGVNNGVLDLLLHLARAHDPEILIVRVTEGDPSLINDHSYPKAVFDKFRTTFHVLKGNDVDKVIDTFVDTHKVDMVCSVHRHLGLFETLFHRSASKRMAMHTHVPLLVLQQ